MIAKECKKECRKECRKECKKELFDIQALIKKYLGEIRLL
mgnify:CR=1 FL=1